MNIPLIFLSTLRGEFLGIVFGLTAAVCWGSADLLARYTSRLIGPMKTLMLMQIFGFAGITIYLVASGELIRFQHSATPEQWGWGVFVALFSIGGALALYRAFAVGTMSIVSPIGASYAALTVLLAYLSGEKLTAVHAIGIVVSLVGVTLAALHLSQSLLHAPHKALMRGVGWALLAAVLNAFVVWMLGFKVTPGLGSMVPVWLFRTATLLSLGAFSIFGQRDSSLPRGNVWWWLAGLGIIDTVGFVALLLGLMSAQVSIVSVTASLFSAVTIVLARFFLRESMAPSQWFGVGMILAGIALVSI